MIGAWAGELGPLQFTPSDYYKNAVDYDGDGRRDLIHSVPDVLASGANFLAAMGWKRGEPWLQEVRAGTGVPWDQADLSIKHPRSQWARWGVTYADGRPLPADDLRASLLLPMGLCSDGLWEMVRRQDLVGILQQEEDPQQICNRLIDTANANGGEDNITAVVVKVRAG
jgi:membrane-bound lytic murein transglycosylase B